MAKKLLNKVKYTRDSFVLLLWKYLLVRTSSPTPRTADVLPTIHITFLVHEDHVFPKMWWFLDVSPVRVMSCQHTYLNMVSDSSQLDIWILLNPVVKLKGVAAGKPYVSQQDSADCHTSWNSQKWLSDYMYYFTNPVVWPLNSTDYNPIDYPVWGAVEKKTKRTTCNTKARWRQD